MTSVGEWDDVVCGSARQFVCERPDSDQASSASPSPACSCASDWRVSLDLDKCYKRLNISGGISQAAARSRCQVTKQRLLSRESIIFQNDGADLASITSAFENSSMNIEQLIQKNTHFHSILVVWDVLTGDSNKNNGWIGGTDADTEVRHHA